MRQAGMAGAGNIAKLAARAGGFGTRIALWRAARARAATGFVAQPEPRSIGLFSRGRQMLAGNFLMAGDLVEQPGVPIWDVSVPDAGAAAEVHGFAWLDDLAAVGDAQARRAAQDWTWDWIARYGTGRGPGWTPDLTGRRLIRWINHGILLLSAREKVQSAAYFRLLTTQTVYLSRHWQRAAPGLPRFEALTGMISAGLALTGMEGLVAPAIAALAADCRTEVDGAGGIPTRNPEDLLEVFTLLTWAVQALSEADRIAPPEVLSALERIAPTLRALRHADGGLARFHGGGRGIEGRLDQALAQAGVRAQSMHGLSMGFARLAGGRTTVIVDVAGPPGGRASVSAHASTCGFEMTSGRRPVIVSCGSGAPFGADWRRAGRATPSHSTLAVDGFSSSRLSGDAAETLTDCAVVTTLRQQPTSEGPGLHVVHNGWSLTHGLSHVRDLALSMNG
ncbi:MAG: heparinase II/III family protein, partial [Paracoccaceae bacterium]